MLKSNNQTYKTGMKSLFPVLSKGTLLYRLFLFISIGFAGSVYAQNTQISGTVTEATSNEPLPGAYVLIKGTDNGTVTDIDGRFAIAVSPTDTLVVTFMGYTAEEFVPGNQTSFTISLKEDLKQLDEIVVVAYGTVKKSDLTGSISSVKGDVLTSVPASSAIQSLQGKVAGIRVVSNSGAPGEAPTVRVRGIGTFGDASPIYIVDGLIVQDITFLNPSDIASMEVLKDASSTSLYGSRGANGVIIVTTKSGQSGKTSINISADYGIQRIPKYIDMLSAREFAETVNKITPGTFNNLNLLKDTDWQKEVYKDYAPIQNYQGSVSGGSEKTGYYVGFGYFQQDGIIPKSGFKKTSLKINNFYLPFKPIKLGHNITITDFRQDNSANVVASTLRAWPTDPAYNDDGSFFGNRGNGNPLASIEYTNSYREGIRAVGNFYGEVTFLDDFKFKSSFGVDLEYAKSQSFTPVFFVTPQQQNAESNLSKGQSQVENWLWENTLTYDKTFINHSLNVLLGYTSQEDNYENIGGSAVNLLRDFLTYLPTDLENINSIYNNAGIESRVSYLFRANYVAFDKYLLTFSFRRDGSSRFAKQNRWGNFPSAALGWRISDESFFSPLTNVISNAKIRVSYGLVGNDKVDVNSRYTLINQGAGAVFGTEEVLNGGATFGTSGNPDIKWEEIEQLDAGLELDFFEGKLNTEFDYYRKVTNGILVPLQVPATFGNGSFATTYFNAANVLNSGLEITLTWNGTIGDIKYTLGANATTIHNEVLSISENTGNTEFISIGSLGNGQNVKRIEKGQPIGYFYGYKVAGIFQNVDELDLYPRLSLQGVGDFRYVDVNGDGEITTDDRTFLGSEIPDLMYGLSAQFSYKGFELAFDFQGEAGKEIYNGKTAVRSGQFNYETSVLNAWDGEGSSNTEPRITASGVNYSQSDWFVQDGSYLRLRTASLSYNLKNSLISKAKMTQAKVFLRGTNVFTIAKYTGYTPEIGGDVNISGVDTGIYPITSVYTLGLNITF